MLAFLIAGALLLVIAAFVVRNALAFVVAIAGATAAWTLTHDLPATCVAAAALLFLASLLLGLSATSSSPLICRMTLGAEAATASLAAATLAFMLFQEGQNMQAIIVTVVSAGVVGAGMALGNRALQR